MIVFRNILLFILSGVLCSLICSLISQHRDLRKLKETYEKKYGRKYCDDPGKIKKSFVKFRRFFCRLFGLSCKVSK